MLFIFILLDKNQSTANPSEMRVPPPTPDKTEIMLAETLLAH